jgi:LPXTG-motif cell wall-anchored protein
VKTVASLYFLVAPAIAQTITPITDSTGSTIPWYAWAGLAAAVAAIAYVVLKKKDPAILTTVTTAGSGVVSELTSLLHKAADTAATTAATIQSQAAVIAAPAVQAAVNAAPASAQPALAAAPAAPTSFGGIGSGGIASQLPNLGAPMADPNGPPRSNNQSFPLDTGRGWWVSPAGSNPPGYVYDLPWPAVTTKAGTASTGSGPPSAPYTGQGLNCVISQVGNTQTMRTNAEKAVEAGASPFSAAQWHATNDNADPTWTAAVSQVVVGIDPATAYRHVSKPGQAPVGGVQFDEAMLAATLPVINSFR